MPVLQHRRHGENPLLVVEDSADDPLNGQAHGVVGHALALDDAVGGADDVVGDALALGLVEDAAVQGLAPLGDRHTADLAGRPQRHLGISVLTGDVAVDVLGGRPGLQRDQVTHAGGVQDGAGAEDLILGQVGDLLGAVGHHVHRVGHRQEDRVGGDLDQLGQDLLHDAHGGSGELQAGLARLLLRTRGDGDDIGIATDLGIVRAGHGTGRGELNPLRDVEGLGLDLLLGDILQHDLAGDALGHAGVSERRSHGARADDRNLGWTAPRGRWVGALCTVGDGGLGHGLPPNRVLARQESRPRQEYAVCTGRGEDRHYHGFGRCCACKAKAGLGPRGPRTDLAPAGTIGGPLGGDRRQSMTASRDSAPKTTSRSRVGHSPGMDRARKAP